MAHSRTMDGVMARSTVRGNADPRRESFGLVIPRAWYRDMDNDAAVQPHVLLAELGVESDWSGSGDHGADRSSPVCQEQGGRPSAPCGASSDGVDPTLSPGREMLQQRTEKEKQQLREKVEALALYERTRDSVTELYSLHSFDVDAKFRFLSRTFCEWLQVPREKVIGHPLSSIVDPRDEWALRTILLQALNPASPCHASSSSCDGEEPTLSGGSTVHVRVLCGTTAISHEASMTVVIGSRGLIVVTRLFGA